MRLHGDLGHCHPESSAGEVDCSMSIGLQLLRQTLRTHAKKAMEKLKRALERAPEDAHGDCTLPPKEFWKRGAGGRSVSFERQLPLETLMTRVKKAREKGATWTSAPEDPRDSMETLHVATQIILEGARGEVCP